MLEQTLVFTSCSSIQFFNSLPSLNTVNEAALGSLPLTVQPMCDLMEAKPHHLSPSTSHLNLQSAVTLINCNFNL